MKRVILDTSFILTCIKQKIDFFEELKFMGFVILIPKQVIRELEFIANSDKKASFKDIARLALELLDKNNFKEVDLKMKSVDNGLVKFAEQNRNLAVATLDKGLKNKISNSKIIIREKKRLEAV